MPNTPPTPTDIDAVLSATEARLASLGEALRDTEATRLELASVQLHQAALAVSALVESRGRQAFQSGEARERVTRIARLIAQLREQMTRRAAFVDRALASVLPQADAGPTYGNGNARGTFGSRGGAARIYANRF